MRATSPLLFTPGSGRQSLANHGVQIRTPTWRLPLPGHRPPTAEAPPSPDPQLALTCQVLALLSSFMYSTCGTWPAIDQPLDPDSGVISPISHRHLATVVKGRRRDVEREGPSHCGGPVGLTGCVSWIDSIRRMDIAMGLDAFPSHHLPILLSHTEVVLSVLQCQKVLWSFPGC
ncbi:hypothetical protein BGZ61DRAFT_187516 [Ilyonectria robusta]|uniref:uncharacterized protein n=1 Tax=Ilyonectria robusta TaxID=1079257 RepID=UPI001E8E073B|nr:uncharacterized protein BGZ61DRAFT_187516 [Ilyonectria robusta]KAH8729796.1 hypothetical protein BGZ61DRAFT_187516 [Ilyonectria robusta]